MALEIYKAGAIPFTVGGDHSLMYPDVAVAAAHYGRGNVAVIHLDAHFDGLSTLYGHPLSHGSMVKLLIDEGHINGEDLNLNDQMSCPVNICK
jgi:agmatinase